MPAGRNKYVTSKHWAINTDPLQGLLMLSVSIYISYLFMWS